MCQAPHVLMIGTQSFNEWTLRVGGRVWACANIWIRQPMVGTAAMRWRANIEKHVTFDHSGSKENCRTANSWREIALRWCESDIGELCIASHWLLVPEAPRPTVRSLDAVLSTGLDRLSAALHSWEGVEKAQTWCRDNGLPQPLPRSRTFPPNSAASA